MSFLSEYLARQREAREAEDAQREADAASPEAILESLNTNTGHTNDLIGRQAADSKAQNQQVVEHLDLIANAVADAKPEANEVELAIKQGTEVEQKTGQEANKQLKELSGKLQELVDTNKQIEKYVNKSRKKKALALARRKNKKENENGDFVGKFKNG